MNTLKPPIFIVGCGHSGTSLLVRILGAHSQICAIPFESYFALKWPTPRPEWERFFSHCDTYTLRMGKARWLEKTPNHILHLKEIISRFPSGKVLLMLRDGRDVANSLRQRYGTLESGCERWIEDNRAGQPFWTHPNVHLVRYENIVEDFEKTMREIMDFVGEAFEDSLLRYHETPHYFFTSQIEKPQSVFGENNGPYRNWQINQPLFDGRNKWLNLSDEEKGLLKEKLGKMLIEYGYERDLNW